MANVLNTDKQIAIIGALAAGVTGTTWSVADLVEATA